MIFSLRRNQAAYKQLQLNAISHGHEHGNVTQMKCPNKKQQCLNQESFELHRCWENVKRFNDFYFVKFDFTRTHWEVRVFGRNELFNLFFRSLSVFVCAGARKQSWKMKHRMKLAESAFQSHTYKKGERKHMIRCMLLELKCFEIGRRYEKREWEIEGDGNCRLRHPKQKLRVKHKN